MIQGLKYFQTNTGLINSLNYTSKCNYDIVMRIDGDDEIKEDKPNTVKLFQTRKLWFFGTGAEIIDINSRVKKLINAPEDNINILNNMKNLKPLLSTHQ